MRREHAIKETNMAQKRTTSEKRLRLLLSDGFFAAQIPPSFGPTSFSSHHKIFGVKWDAIKEGKSAVETTFERYSVARVGHSRRPIAITNPVAAKIGGCDARVSEFR
jgi:hypothetical protein